MKLNIMFKLLASFTALVAVMIALGVISMVQMNQLNAKTEFIGTSDLPAVRTIGKIQEAMAVYRQKQLQHVISDTADEMAGNEKEIQEYANEIETEFANYEALIADDQDRALMEKTNAAWDRYLAQSSPLIEASKKFDTDAAISILNGEAADTYTQLVQAGADEWSL